MDFNQQLTKLGEFGVIEQVHDSIVVASGLPDARLHEIVLFEMGGIGEVYLLNEDTIEILVFSRTPLIPGMKVTRSDAFLSVPVGEEFLGSTINPLGANLSAGGRQIAPTQWREIDVAPPGISKRAKISSPLVTGVTAIDLMVPLGKGQKELVIGDRKAGKTSFLLAAIKSQVSSGAIAIYAGIAKRKSDIKKIQQFLREQNLENRTIVVASSSYDSPSLIYLTPYSAMTIAEYFRDMGQDVILVLDDLSSHAYFYREIALVAKRFPGRDAYPGDIFHTHARLLERAGNFKTETGTASITVLPVAEVVEGDLTGYITTNLMSMTDGHIFFDGNVYFEGRRPAVNIPLSVTRVGRQAQSSLLRSINREISAFLTLFERVQNLSHFGAEVSSSVQTTILTGETIYKYFNQHYNLLIPPPVQVILFALLWLSFLHVDEETLEETKKQMIESYNNSLQRELFDEAMKKETFNELLSFVASHKEEFLVLCKTKK